MISIKKIFKNLLGKKDLNYSEASKLVQLIFGNKLSEVEISSILTLLYIKGERFDEIYSFVEYLKKKCVSIPIKGDLMDTCGTGGDNKNSFNFSTATSILLSACDVKIVKHGNRSVTSKSGSFDVLESLGIDINLNLKDQQKFFKKNNICFLFAPNFHSSLKLISPIRQRLPFRTIFNLLGPLLNPCKLKYQLLGVSNKQNLITHAKCLSKIKIKSAWVVFNLNGYDELTTTSPNIITEIKNGKIFKERKIHPNDLGFKVRNEEELHGGTGKENAYMMKRLFEGETGAIRDNVLLNTSAGLLICEKVKNLNEGIELATRIIDSGKALKKLEEIIK